MDNSELEQRLNIITDEAGRSLTAAELTEELALRGWLPELWTTLDVADFIRDRTKATL